MEEPEAPEVGGEAAHGVICGAIDNNRGEVGVAILDLATGKLQLHQAIEMHASCGGALALLEAAGPTLVIICASTAARAKASPFAEVRSRRACCALRAFALLRRFGREALGSASRACSWWPPASPPCARRAATSTIRAAR